MNRLLKLTVSLEPQPASQFSELVCISIACGTPFKRVSDLRSGCHSSTSRHTDHLSLFYFIQKLFDLTPILEFKSSSLIYSGLHNSPPFADFSTLKWQSSGMAATHEYWSQNDAHLVYLPIFHGLNLIIFS